MKTDIYSNTESPLAWTPEIRFTAKAGKANGGIQRLCGLMRTTERATALLKHLLFELNIKVGTWNAARFQGRKESPVLVLEPSYDEHRHVFEVRTGPFVGFLTECQDKMSGQTLRTADIWARWLHLRETLAPPAAGQIPDEPELNLDAVGTAFMVQEAWHLRDHDNNVSATDLVGAFLAYGKKHPEVVGHETGWTALRAVDSLIAQGYFVELDTDLYGFEDKAMELLQITKPPERILPFPDPTPPATVAPPMFDPAQFSSYLAGLQQKAERISGFEKERVGLVASAEKHRKALQDSQEQIEVLEHQMASRSEELHKVEARLGIVDSELTALATDKAAIAVLQKFAGN